MLLELSSAPMKARELIAERVRAECDDRLMDMSGRLAARLLARNPREADLNGAPRPPGGDTDIQIARALWAFAGSGFILLIDDRRIEAPDDEVRLAPETAVTFLKLTPLVGG